MRSRWVLLHTLLALSLAGCCSTSERVLVFERAPADEDIDCEEICQRTVVPEGTDRNYEYMECREGFTEQNAPAVLCTFAQTYCGGPH